DGVPIEEFPLAYLRQQVCMVLQDPFLFADSLAENISYDDPERSLEDIRQSAELAALESTLNDFPNGLNTLIGERGVTLSGGQKQRAALARGLIRMAPILILDDCFSAVDTETEEKILRGLAQHRASATTIIVSNRISTVRHADQILFLLEGNVVEAGTHTSLIEARGHYFELAQQQNALATQQNDRGNNLRPSDKLAEGPTEDSRDTSENAVRGEHDES
ncbi:MAG: ABC transporter ATP-binding protein, partial [Gammaproteobacteria bacterium]